MFMKRIKTAISSFLLLLSIFTLTASSALASTYGWSGLADFGAVTDFSLFLTGDLKFYNSDIEGRAAVGGNAQLKSFSIGLKSSPSDYSLITGGDLHAGGEEADKGGQVNNGGILTGGDAVLERVGIPAGDVRTAGELTISNMTVENGRAEADKNILVKNSMVSGSVTSGAEVKLVNSTTGPVAASNNVIMQSSAVIGNVQAGEKISATDSGITGDAAAGTTITLENSNVLGEAAAPAAIPENVLNHQNVSLFDFASIDLKSLSDSLWNQSMSLVNLEADQDNVLKAQSGTNFFKVLAQELENSGSLEICAPSDAVVIVNVEGGNQMTIHHKAFRLSGGIDSTNIIYNFHDADEMDLQHLAVSGSFLAPDAHLAFYDSVLEGILMAESLFGGTLDPNDQLLHSVQINTPPQPVPVPASALLLAAGLMMLLLLKHYWSSHIKPKSMI